MVKKGSEKQWLHDLMKANGIKTTAVVSPKNEEAEIMKRYVQKEIIEKRRKTQRSEMVYEKIY